MRGIFTDSGAQLAGVFGVDPNQMSRWKAELLVKLPGIFSDNPLTPCPRSVV